MKYFIHTFGCQMNTADSERIAGIFAHIGFLSSATWEDADIVILNTCSVRQKGEDRVFGFLRDIRKHAHANQKQVWIGVSGCMIRKSGVYKTYLPDREDKNRPKQIVTMSEANGFLNCDDKIFSRTDTIDFVFRVEDVQYVPKILSFLTHTNLGDDEKYENYLKIQSLSFLPHVANVVVQTGCDNFCTYCIVPHSRGREQSRPAEDIVEEVKKAAQAGAKEVRLLGQNVNSYGKDKESSLWDEKNSKWHTHEGKTPFRKLLDGVNEVEGIDRIRFSSSNPHDMTSDILDAHFEDAHLCHYLHFALQSGDDRILKAMNRKHTYAQFRDQVNYLRAKDPYFAISTDIIVGFPGETDKQFENTMKAFEELSFDFAYIARYSPRPGTISEANMKDDVSAEIKAKRWHTLNNTLLESSKKRMAMMIGQIEEVLIDGISRKGNPFGRTRTFKEVFLPADLGLVIGQTVRAKMMDVDGWVLIGEVV